jgi:phage head maturation protease
MPDLNDPIYRYITVKERESIPLEDFAWPDAPDRPEYPIDTQEHLDSAAKLLGHAPENKQASIKARAIRIAKRHGFTLPESWQKEKEDKKRMDDQSDILRSLPTNLNLYLPIVRVDPVKREVIVRATSEALDSYKTIFDFEASKEAFSNWRGNIREMHQQKAVGRALNWEPVEDEKAIDVHLRVSKGAPDTWEKVLDGTLAGASVGARNGVWEKRMIDGEEVPVLVRYDLVEVSLVDNPANPDCTIQIVRADGMITDQLGTDEDEEELPPAAETAQETRNQEPEDTRAGATISHATQGQLHSLRDGLLMQLDRTLDICMCEECAALCALIDPDNDGDFDILPSLDYDHDGGASGDGSGNGSTDPGMMYLSMKAELTRQLSPIITRFNAIGGRLSQVNTTSQADPETTRRLQAVESKLNELDDKYSLLSEIKGLVERIAAQPQGGGPVINSSAMRQTQVQPPDDTAMIERLSRAGVLTKQQQINAALYLQKQGMIGE